MQLLLNQARDAVMANDIGKTLLSGEMARAMVSRLDPGSTIFWHVDDGPYHKRTGRFHAALVTNPGCFLYSQEEMQHLPQGVLAYFNNHVRHCADRKSTRLNSSHQIISYAVFCLKKKNNH